uniref:Cytochrome c oxidase subunit 2 n=1 Tax=Nacolus tuberculatus TaxID=2800230 RepID=A0A7T7BYV7_9HEMI|nr:cytochrome c oxidase subunit II [Nacolus tuberculatus]QQK57723.1 cytochrome c oxidase subunit II [Nacolus tuberculatus]
MKTWKTNIMQDANSPLMEQLILFHDHTMIIIMMITVMVTYVMLSMLTNKYINRNLLESQMIEMIWTLIPAIMLVFIALPSLKILYLIEENINPAITIKAIGHQWFWSYEYSDFKKIEFESYMKPVKEMMIEEFRLLEVDNRMIMPFNVKARILVSSTDVIHSWTVPSLGIKIDASPGRINQGNMLINRPGLFFGQCSEICGSNHSFMPISVEMVNMKMFTKWLMNY